LKRYIFTFIGLLVALTAFGRLFSEFKSWDDLTEQSPDIVIARCTSTLGSDTTNKFYVIIDGWIPSEIEVVSVLKGNTRLGAAHMMSTYWPHRDEQFLLFGTYHSDTNFGRYTVNEDYRVIPLNHYFKTNMLPGGTLEEKIRWVLQSRLTDLNEELEKGQKEKKRLEAGLK
jgi:hypothetical protein